jgi:hypothetical protein
VAQIVGSAERWSLLRPTCLTRSLTLGRLLRRQGLAANLRLGVAMPNGRFAAHAWVEHGGVVLNDTQDVARRYAPLERVSPRRGDWR